MQSLTLKLSIPHPHPLHCAAAASLKYKHGRLVLEVPLPSRNEKCLFFLRPMLMSVGDLIGDLQKEDPGATASVLSKGKTCSVCNRCSRSGSPGCAQKG